jgi:hypothetical protein
VLAVICVALFLGAASATPAPGSYRVAIEATLARHGVEHQGVRVVDGCAPSYQFCRYYHGQVTVRSGKPLQGEITCRWRWTGCTLTIAELGLHGEPLPDITTPLAMQDIEQLARDATDGLRRAFR